MDLEVICPHCDRETTYNLELGEQSESFTVECEFCDKEFNVVTFVSVRSEKFND